MDRSKVFTWMLGVSGAGCVVAACVPPHMRVWDDVCMFMAGASLSAVVADLTLGRALRMVRAAFERGDVVEASGPASPPDLKIVGDDDELA